MKQKGQTKQNTRKELKETLNWTSSTEDSSTGDPAPVYPVEIGCTGAQAPEQYAVLVPISQVAPDAPVLSS